ncbi:MAG: formate dehydrogenase accessory protein FdhE [Deltaproteobacteria bacterium]|nr:MAG: formate dehydrogenase accessory protein FdhE [Deltaproteobacteria bacterium]
MSPGLKRKAVSLAQIKKEIDHNKTKESVSKDYLDFQLDLIRTQYKNRRKLTKSIVYPKLSADTVKERLKEGFYLVDFPRIKVSRKVLDDTFKDVCSVIEKYDTLESGELERLKAKEASGELPLRDLIENIIAKNKEYFERLSGKLEIKKEALVFIAENLVRPLLILEAQRLQGKIKDDIWLRNYCPICGNEPRMVRLERETGRRILECSLCYTQWVFKILECPFCGNNDQKTLRFFFLENDIPHRVDVCDKCKRYIKTLDERKLEEGKEAILRVEDIATIHLDMLAEREGYKVTQ